MSTSLVAPGRPDWARPKLAPAGDRLAAVRWHDGAANLWIGASHATMRLATDLRPWRLEDFHWGASGRGLVLVLEPAASEARMLAWLDLRSGAVTPLTSELADAQYAGQAGGDKPAILLGVRDQLEDGFKLRAVTPAGAVIAEWQGPAAGPVTRWLATGSQALAVCGATPAVSWWHSGLAHPRWALVADIPAADAECACPVAFSSDGRTLFALSSEGRDTLALVQMSQPSWAPAIVSSRAHFDVTAVLMAPDGSRPDLVTTTDPVDPQSALTDAAAADLARLRQATGGVSAVITDRNESHLLAEIADPVGGPAYLTVSRTTTSAGKPLLKYTSLKKVRIQRRDPFTCRARDGLPLTGFLTRPDGVPPWPTVLLVHDGPWTRDKARMDPCAQLLASAGFCCVQVNYRGSRGFGKEFRDAGDGQWSRAMQNDLVDALESAQVADVVDPTCLAAMGHGYGGYAALMLATQRDLPLSCVISASAPTDLALHAEEAAALGEYRYTRRIGDPVLDRDQLAAASPVNKITEFEVPALLFHGRRDARVPVAHTTRLAESLRLAGRPVELVVYEDEGHTYARPQNIADFRARSFEFLLSRLCCPANSGV